MLPDAGLDEHLVGTVKEFEYFLKETQGFFKLFRISDIKTRILYAFNIFLGEYPLDREYTWIKCNKNFNGFYVTDYFDRDFEAFEKLIKNNDDEIVIIFS